MNTAGGNFVPGLMEMMLLSGGGGTTTLFFLILVLWTILLATYKRDQIKNLASFRLGYLLLMLALILVPAMQIVETRSVASSLNYSARMSSEGEAFLQILYHLLVPTLLAASFTMIMGSLIPFSMIYTQQRSRPGSPSAPTKHPLDE
jgi:hypothetical protein